MSKYKIFANCSHVRTTIWVPHSNSYETEKKLYRNYPKMLPTFWTNPRRTTPQNSSCMAIYVQSRKLSKKVAQDMMATVGKSKDELMSNEYELVRMDTPFLEDQQNFTLISKVQTLDCRLDDLPRAMTDWDRWQERVQRNPCCQHALMMMMMMMMKIHVEKLIDSIAKLRIARHYSALRIYVQGILSILFWSVHSN